MLSHTYKRISFMKRIDRGGQRQPFGGCFVSYPLKSGRGQCPSQAPAYLGSYACTCVPFRSAARNTTPTPFFVFPRYSMQCLVEIGGHLHLHSSLIPGPNPPRLRFCVAHARWLRARAFTCAHSPVVRRSWTSQPWCF